jgi:Transposase IS66 family
VRFIWFNLMPWPYLPDDFREKYRSVWVDIPSALYDPVRGHSLRRSRLYVHDDRPFAGPDPPATLFFYSRNRGGEHPARHLAGYAGILYVDAGACPRAGQRPDPWAGYGIDPQAWLADVLRRSPIIPLPGSTSCCPGIGSNPKSRPLPPDNLTSRPWPDGNGIASD